MSITYLAALLIENGFDWRRQEWGLDGNPFTAAVRTVNQQGVKDGPIGPQATGYNIVEAASLSAAAEMAKGCPLLMAGRQIAVYEMFSAM